MRDIEKTGEREGEGGLPVLGVVQGYFSCLENKREDGMGMRTNREWREEGGVQGRRGEREKETML